MHLPPGSIQHHAPAAPFEQRRARHGFDHRNLPADRALAQPKPRTCGRKILGCGGFDKGMYRPHRRQQRTVGHCSPA
jgi:hypothetical protein